MPFPTLSALAAAAAAGDLEPWLSSLPEGAPRSRVRRAIEMDRRLWTEHPASLPTCLLARAHDLDGLDVVRRAWIAELDARANRTPWVRPLRALPLGDGLLAELHDGAGLSLAGLHLPRFLSDEVVVLEAGHFHPSVQAPDQRRRDRLSWRWTRGEASLEPDPGDEIRAPQKLPRIVHEGWGPSYLVREPGAARVPLPCPEGGTADARFSDDGRRLFVYGSHDEYAGGFAYVVDPATLAIQRRLETSSPVSRVHEGARAPKILLLETYRGLVFANGDALQPLPMAAKFAALSPSGRHVATVDGALRVWSIAEIGRIRAPTHRAFPTCFDPSGDRLLSGQRLFDGRTGAEIAVVPPELGTYLEGGPGWPWFHLGEQFLICLHGSLSAWETRRGAPAPVRERLRFPQWFALAYDRAGTRLAALHEKRNDVEVHELPSGRALGTIRFDLAGRVVAMSPDGATIAVREGTEVEVRSSDGTPIRRLAHPGRADPGKYERTWGTTSLRFSADGRRLASFREEDGWRIWALDGDDAEHLREAGAIDAADGFAIPTLRDWDVQPGTRTVFVHQPTGTRVALPVTGPWVQNPAEPRVLACDDLHVELRGG